MRSVVLYLANKIIHCLPETRMFGFKRFLLRVADVKIGLGVKICSSVTIIGNGKLTIGKETWIGPQTLICCSDNVDIGADCDIAPRVYIGDGTHAITPDAKRIAGHDCAIPIKIGNGCWICANASVLPGVEIGDKCIVAAGAVVSKGKFDNFSLIGGIPARLIRKYE